MCKADSSLARPRVFISYAQENPAHAERVRELAYALADDGLAVELDQFHGQEILSWSHWCEERLDPANTDFVLMVCSAEYRRRIENKVAFDVGRGAFWEGALIYGYLNEEKGNSRFVPLLLDDEPETGIPRVFFIWTRFRLRRFGIKTGDQDYENLYRLLTGQPATPRPIPGTLKWLPPLSLPELRLDLPETPGSSVPFFTNSLPNPTSAANDFFGRKAEQRSLNQAWGDNTGTAIIELIAFGGVGKTALVQYWLGTLRAASWRGAKRVFVWSFFSQGTGDDRQASDDQFLAKALDWFGVALDPTASPWEKGRQLAQAVLSVRTLLILDGIEPLQYPPGQYAEVSRSPGNLRTPGLSTLLEHLAAAGQPGLTVITSREYIADLNDYIRCDTRPQGSVLRLDLGNLNEDDGARLLYKAGVQRAGEAAIDHEDSELKDAVRLVGGHALTLWLLGRYLHVALGGDIRRRDQVDLSGSTESQGHGKATRVMAAYETWFAREHVSGARQLAALRLLGFFNHPASSESLYALRAAPPIPGLTDALFETPSGGGRSVKKARPISERQWRTILVNLAEIGLIDRDDYSPEKAELAHGCVNAHPLVREYLADSLWKTRPKAWIEGHRRIYKQLKASVEYRPSTRDGLRPLYQAIIHGCSAGLLRLAYKEVYRDRILQGEGQEDAYSVKKLGAFGEDLSAVACFFREPWKEVRDDFPKLELPWLFYAASYRLRALGRLTEALEAAHEAVRMAVSLKDWRRAAYCAYDLSEVALLLGRTDQGEDFARKSMEYADLVPADSYREAIIGYPEHDTRESSLREDERQLSRIVSRYDLANVLLQQDRRGEAMRYFKEAEDIQQKKDENRPLLWSLAGFRYCDLLLSYFERAAWQAWESRESPLTANEHMVDGLQNVEKRAKLISAWGVDAGAVRLTAALDSITLGRVVFLRAVLESLDTDVSPLLDQAVKHLAVAVDLLYKEGRQDYRPYALTARAWVRAWRRDTDGARADLDEAWKVASRGGMRLFMADCCLYRARIFRQCRDLEAARKLIDQCGYGRRRGELEDAVAASQRWPTDE
jgi:tetratricopeptide (TPR) repeat protein